MTLRAWAIHPDGTRMNGEPRMDTNTKKLKKEPVFPAWEEIRQSYNLPLRKVGG